LLPKGQIKNGFTSLPDRHIKRESQEGTVSTLCEARF
jgi:hypothetical protein